jgi:hypothetical protein
LLTAIPVAPFVIPAKAGIQTPLLQTKGIITKIYVSFHKKTWIPHQVRNDGKITATNIENIIE